MNDYLTFAKVAEELGCTLKEVRSLVVENKTLRATRITKNGLVLSSCGPEGHFPYDLDLCCHLDDNGEITSDVYGSDLTGQTVLLKTLDVGALRIERADLENFRTEHPSRLVPNCALEVPESKEQRQDTYGSAQIGSVMPPTTASTSAGVESLPTREPDNNAATGPVFFMTRGALVAKYRHDWESIDRDLKDAGSNGLSAAKAGNRDWREGVALDWARAKGKLKSAVNHDRPLEQAMHKMSSLPGRKHTLQD